MEITVSGIYVDGILIGKDKEMVYISQTDGPEFPQYGDRERDGKMESEKPLEWLPKPPNDLYFVVSRSSNTNYDLAIILKKKKNNEIAESAWAYASDADVYDVATDLLEKYLAKIEKENNINRFLGEFYK